MGVAGLRAFSAQQQFGTDSLGIRDISFNFVPVRGIGHRTNGRRHVHGIAITQGFGGVGKFDGKVIMERIMDMEPAGRRTNLPGIKKCTEDRALHRSIHIGIREDDEGWANRAPWFPVRPAPSGGP